MKKSFIIGFSVFGFVIAVIASIYFTFTRADEIGATPAGKLAQELGVSVEEAKKVLEVFKAVGIEDYSSITRDEMLDDMDFDGEKGYRVSARGVSNIILYLKDGEVYRMRYADRDLYHNGKVLSKFID